MKKYITDTKQLCHKTIIKLKEIRKMKKKIFKFIFRLLECLKLILDVIEKLNKFFN